MSRSAETSSPAAGFGRAVYRMLLRSYPPGFRRRFANDMLADYDRMAASCRYAGLRGRVALWRRLLHDLARSAARQRLHRGSKTAPAGYGWRPGGLGSDLRHGTRSLLCRPGFSSVLILTLAVGLGSTTAAYSLANWLLLRPLPGVSDPDELGFVWYGVPREHGVGVRWLTYANLADMTPRLQTLTGLAGLQRGSVVAVFGGGTAESLEINFVTASWFRTLGLEPVAGRFFTAAENDPVNHGSPLAVISHRLAQGRFGGPDAALGATLRVNGRDLHVIGVLTRGFHGTERTATADLWLPGSSMFWVRHLGDQRRPEARRGGTGFYEFVARLSPGATWGQVEDELAGLNAWLADTWGLA